MYFIVTRYESSACGRQAGLIVIVKEGFELHIVIIEDIEIFFFIFEALQAFG